MTQSTANASAVANTGGGDRATRELPAMLSVDDVGALLACSARHVYRLADMGRMPRPVKLGMRGDGYVEVDANPNPLRELLAQPDQSVHDGSVMLASRPGLGVEPDLTRARPFLTEHRTYSV